VLQAVGRPGLGWDVGVRAVRTTSATSATTSERRTGLEDYVGWLGQNFDPSIGWRDLEWIRQAWKGPMIVKGVLDAGGTRGRGPLRRRRLVVSNHGGRQLDGAPSTASALPGIADAVGSELTVLADSGVRSGWTWFACWRSAPRG
jgi:L-lactate dehydrogenase (cytochrome)